MAGFQQTYYLSNPSRVRRGARPSTQLHCRPFRHPRWRALVSGSRQVTGPVPGDVLGVVSENGK